MIDNGAKKNNLKKIVDKKLKNRKRIALKGYL